jgi:prephenate dehydrogenase
MKEPDFKTVAIVGFGLMGGSMALALLEQRPHLAVIGVDRDAAARANADRRGIDTKADLGAVEAADIVVLATPVRSILEQLPAVGERAKEGALIIDLGSTKRDIVHEMDKLPQRVHPIGGHPMCGKELAGFQAAEAGLYRDTVFVLTPLARTTQQTVDRAKAFVGLLGARPIILDADAHDRAVAAVSHLPFTLAATLVNLTTEMSGSESTMFSLAAGGFRDTSRLAASDTRMMLDTLLTNRDNVADMLRAFSRELNRLADSVAAGDERALELFLDRAGKRRREMFK